MMFWKRKKHFKSEKHWAVEDLFQNVGDGTVICVDDHDTLPTVNFLRQSQDFDKSAWREGTPSSSVRFTSGYAVAPDGSMTAGKLEFNSTVFSPQISQLLSLPAGNYVFRGWFKAASSADVGKQLGLYVYSTSLTITLTNSWQYIVLPATLPTVSLIILNLDIDPISETSVLVSDFSLVTAANASMPYERTHSLSAADYPVASLSQLAYSKALRKAPILYEDPLFSAISATEEKSVGLVLDTLTPTALSPELISDGTFKAMSSWSPVYGAVVFDAQGVQISSIPVGGGGVNGAISQRIYGLVVGRTYMVTWDSSSSFDTFGSDVSIQNSNFPGDVAVARAAYPLRNLVFTATATSHWLVIRVFRLGAEPQATVRFEQISAFAFTTGNHVTQATVAKRPVLSRRVNLLTKTEQINSSPWAGLGTSVTPNTGIAPDGTMTACTVTFAAQSVNNFWYTSGALSSIVGTKAVIRLYVKTPTRVLMFGGATAPGTDVYTSTDVGGGWYLQEVVRTFTEERLAAVQHLITSANIGTTPFEVWGASLTSASDSYLPYQRVNTATDYNADPAKFPAYLRFDGSQSSLVCATGGGGTTGFFFSACVAKLGTTNGVLFSDVTGAPANGYHVRISSAGYLVFEANVGGVVTQLVAAQLSLGSVSIVQAWDDGVNINASVNGGTVYSTPRPTMTGGTLGYTIGQDNGLNSGYFNGRIYSVVYRKNSGLTAVEREAVLSYQRRKARLL